MNGTAEFYAEIERTTKAVKPLPHEELACPHGSDDTEHWFLVQDMDQLNLVLAYANAYEDAKSKHYNPADMQIEKYPALVVACINEEENRLRYCSSVALYQQNILAHASIAADLFASHKNEEERT